MRCNRSFRSIAPFPCTLRRRITMKNCLSLTNGPLYAAIALSVFSLGIYRAELGADQSTVHNQKCCSAAVIITPTAAGMGGCEVLTGVCINATGSCMSFQSASIVGGVCRDSESPDDHCVANAAKAYTVPSYLVACSTSSGSCLCEATEYGTTMVTVQNDCAGTPCPPSDDEGNTLL